MDAGRRRAAAAALGLGAALAGCRGLRPEPSEHPRRMPAEAASQYRLVGEFEPMRAVWLSYDAGHEDLTVGLVAALLPHVALKLLVRDDQAAEAAQARLRARGVDLAGVQLQRDPRAFFFVRDAAVFCTRVGTPPAAGLGVIDFAWTHYGVPAWCARRHADDPVEAAACAATVEPALDGLDRGIATLAGARVLPTPLAMEGGGVESNGQGLLIANEELWRLRNPALTLPEIEAELLRLPGVRQVLWLPQGLAEDPHLRSTITGPYVAWGTGGHTDEFVRFADARTVLLAWPEDADVAAHPVARLTRQRMQRCLDILTRFRGADGVALRVLKVPMPRPIERRVFLSAAADTAWSREWTADFFPPAEGRRQGQPVQQLATASYLNFVLANGALVLPDYLRHGTPRAVQERVRRIFAEAFPGRRISFVDAITAHWVGGGLHCATLTQP
jgi:agmatine deiminase